MDKVYVVAGYMNTGSGSLTYPEDFDTIGFFLTRKEAQDHADALNEKEGALDEDGEVLDCGDYDGMVYEVEEVKNLSKRGK